VCVAATTKNPLYIEIHTVKILGQKS